MMDEANFYPEMKGRLSGRDCRHLKANLTASRRYAAQFPTAADAMAAGFHMIVPYVHGMGAHYIGPDGIPTTVNPDRPNFLLYGGNGPDAPLVGLMWFVNSGQAPPVDGGSGSDGGRHEMSKTGERYAVTVSTGTSTYVIG